MSMFRLILLSIRHFWKMNAAVAAGVAVGAAVLTGALLVGDSMQGSLRDLVLNGLGRIDEVLVADHFFREELTREADSFGGEREKILAAPLILYVGSLKTVDPAPHAGVDQVNLIGCNQDFWEFSNQPTPALRSMERDTIILNEPLARLLGVKAGDSVMLGLPKPGGIPAESAFGRKRVSVETMRLKIDRIIPADGLGRFALRPNQRVPLNAYVSLPALQSLLHEQGRVNAIVRQAPPQNWPWHPELADYGIQVEPSPQGYVDVTTEKMIFSRTIEQALRKQLDGLDVQPTLTYLANTISHDKLEVPYSTVTALDFQDKPPLGPFLALDGSPARPLGDGEIALNTWAADRLKARPGDTITIRYFEPESNFGLLTEKTADLKLAAIIKLEGAAADKRLTPTVRGLTDKNTIEDWDLPFEIQRNRIKSDDDRYWTKFKATPKAFVSLATGRRLWASRFGQTTALRIRPAAGETAAGAAQQLARRLDLDPVAQGFVFRPVKALALEAASGSTPFGGLFLGFSFFVIVAAVMLVMLLFRLGIEQRARNVGLLLAIGFRPRQVTRLLAGEGLLVAIAGSLIGTVAGVGYAALMLLGLRTWWLPAIGTPFLALHVSWQSPTIGFLCGLLLALLAVWLAVRRMGRVAPRRLLAGSISNSDLKSRVIGFRSHISSLTSVCLLVLAVAPAAILFFVRLSDDAQVGAFFGAGSLTLLSLLTIVYLQLRRGATGPAVACGRGNVIRMALRNAARNPGRSALAIGLTASACFLIAAVSVFRVDPARQADERTSGSGGFALIGQSELPIHFDLDTPQGRKDMGFEADEEKLLGKCRFYSFRVKSGDDASCLNLYQAGQPRLLGVGPKFIARGGFSWADANVANPWEMLAPDAKHAAAEEKSLINVVLDQTTANYALKLVWIKDQQCVEIHGAHDRKDYFAVAGLLNDSIFQGDLLMSEDDLHRYAADVAGYRYFLIETPPGESAAVQQALQQKLGDYGFQSESTIERLSTLAAVANTYLATFQSLGGLGLLLGTIGLAVVQWRNVLERRGELALLRAAGFPARTLAFLVGMENALLLLLGLAVGLIAALVAVLPHLMGRGAAVPLVMLAEIFAAVLIAGLGVSILATGGVLRTPILAALREDR